jgi:hypothetical protein
MAVKEAAIDLILQVEEEETKRDKRLFKGVTIMKKRGWHLRLLRINLQFAA